MKIYKIFAWFKFWKKKQNKCQIKISNKLSSGPVELAVIRWYSDDVMLLCFHANTW